jgi:hypothetical protein
MLEAKIFRLNGCSNPVDEPYPFLDELHGVLKCVEVAVREDGDGPLNPEILSAALRGAQSLAYLVGQGLDYMDAKREVQRNA